MHKLAVLLTVLFVFIAGSVSAQMCPSTTKFIRIVAFNQENKPVRLNALQVPPAMLPGDDSNCPNQDVMAQMVEVDNENKTIRPMVVAIEKGAVSNPDNVLTDEEVKLYQEKGIVNPPNIRYNTKPKQQPAPIAPTKGQLTANAEADALHSSIN